MFGIRAVLTFPFIAVLVWDITRRIVSWRERAAWNRLVNRRDGGGHSDWGVGGPIPWPSGPRPGLSDRGPRQRGPRAEAEAYAVPEGDR
jgi:hypothetical protein